MRVAVILPDTLRSIGLRYLLSNYFPVVEVCSFPSFTSMPNSGNDIFDYYIIGSDTFMINIDIFLPRRNRTLIITDGEIGDTFSAINIISSHMAQEIIIERLAYMLGTENTSDGNSSENNKDLSTREMDVLQLIVKGITNKEIADKLNISLNTVLTHRKNITAKLGIKTVSGLTFYALMNGIISGDEIEL